jgi:uncharacterized protein YybS (DUF2232 family)
MLDYLKRTLDVPRVWLINAVIGTTLFFCAFLLLQVSPALFPIATIPMIFSPFFLVLTAWRYDSRMALSVAGLSSCLLLFLFNLPVLAFFVTQFAVVGLLLGEGLRKKISPVGLLYATALVSTLLMMAVGAVYLVSSGTSPSTILHEGSEALRKAVSENAQQLQLTPEQLKQYERGLEGLVGFVKVAFPALFFINAFSIVSLNLVLPLNLAGRLGLDRSHVPPLQEITIPFGWVWGLIVSGMVYLLKIPYLKWVGLNVGLILLLAYLVQGYGVLSFFLQRTRLPKIVRGLIYFAFLLHPTLVLLLCGAGLFETWFHFRKRAALRR